MTKNKKESEEKKEPMLALSRSVEMVAARDRDIRIRIRFRFIDTLDAAAKKKKNRPGHSAKLNNTIFMFLVIIILYSTLFCVLRCASFFVCVPYS